MRIPEEVIEEVRARIDIVEIISEYLPVKQAGRNFKALCPFHNEKTPSFMINSDRQIYHCFGCGVGGNVFGFLMAYEKLSYPEAVRRMAERVGVEVPEGKSSEHKDAYDRFYRAIRFARDYYGRMLSESDRGRGARDYLQGRELSSEVLSTFQVGFAPDSRNGLLRAAREEGIPEDDLLKAGLARQGKSGLMDYFWGRIIFPIFNLGGAPAAFGGRIVETGEPKYLNSPDTPIFNKGRFAYGLNFSRDEIRRRGQVVLVEGYLDLISLCDRGIVNGAAGLGTAFTPDQARLLGRYARKVLIAYDPDEAGKRASLRAGEVLLESGLEVGLVGLPEGEDPDLFVRRKGAEAFEKLLDKAVDLVDFLAAAVRDRSGSVESEARKIEELGRVLALVPDELRRSLYIKRIVDKLGIEAKLIERVVSGKKSRTAAPTATAATRTKQVTARTLAERNLLRLMLSDGTVVERVKSRLDPQTFTDGMIRKLAGFIFDYVGSGKEVHLQAVLNGLTDEESQKFVTGLSMEDIPEDSSDLVLDQLVTTIKRDEISKEMVEIHRRIEESDSTGEDDEAVEHLLTRKVELQKLLERLK